VVEVRPSRRTSPSTCRKIRYSTRSDTPGIMSDRDYRWSATQARLLAPIRSYRQNQHADGITTSITEITGRRDRLAAARSDRQRVKHRA
jgi:hypothetical protein